jgi:organic radical activating enzyme
MNTQAPEKKEHRTNNVLDLHSMFLTIQGEGPFSGKPAVFIRLAGCNLKCPQCDTEYTVGRQFTQSHKVAKEARILGRNVSLAVITGGEPFRQNITSLVLQLIEEGFTVQIETNGTLPPSAGLKPVCSTNLNETKKCFIVCSPKTGSVNSEVKALIAAYKYVVNANSIDPEDGLPMRALDHTASPSVAKPPKRFAGPIYLQPADVKNPVTNKLNQNAVVALCTKHDYTVQLQLHKIIGVE